jgi:hypothetical protein
MISIVVETAFASGFVGVVAALTQTARAADNPEEAVLRQCGFFVRNPVTLLHFPYPPPKNNCFESPKNQNLNRRPSLRQIKTKSYVMSKLYNALSTISNQKDIFLGILTQILCFGAFPLP